jgi:hypothetical protein
MLGIQPVHALNRLITGHKQSLHFLRGEKVSSYALQIPFVLTTKRFDLVACCYTKLHVWAPVEREVETDPLEQKEVGSEDLVRTTSRRKCFRGLLRDRDSKMGETYLGQISWRLEKRDIRRKGSGERGREMLRSGQR